MKITIDRAGRVVLPKALRDRFHLVPGTELDVRADTDGIRLEVHGSQPSLVTRHGVLIHTGGNPEPAEIDIAAFINQSREQRSRNLLTP